MGVWQGSGTVREEGILVKFTKTEKKDLEKLAKKAKISMSEYLRRKAFGQEIQNVRQPMNGGKETGEPATQQNEKEESTSII